MSRLALKPLTIPSGVTVTQSDRELTVSGTKGQLVQVIPQGIKVVLKDNQLKVEKTETSLQAKANQGLISRLLSNMLTGVSVGFTKKLELVGTGYRAKKEGEAVVVLAGYSHPVKYQPPAVISLEVPQETVILVSGADKQQVGQVAANLRAIRPPEPYKGKGIRYSGEYIRRKAGKAAKTGAA